LVKRERKVLCKKGRQICVIKITEHAASNARDKAKFRRGLGVTERNTKSAVAGRAKEEGAGQSRRRWRRGRRPRAAARGFREMNFTDR